MIGLLSFYTECYQPLADLTLPIKDKYCKKQGYKHIIVGNGYGDKSIYYAFQRIRFILDYFKSNPDCEALLVLNIQGIIMNHNKRIEEFMPKGFDFMICSDVNGLNAGSYIIKNTEWGNKWMQFILDSEPEYGKFCWKEQKKIMDTWELPEWKSKIKILEHPSINDYFYDLYNWPNSTKGNFSKGNFILNLPGLNLQQRIDIVKSDRVQSQIIY